MEFSDILKMLIDNGVTIAILAYFCLRDWKFMNTLVETLTTIKEMLEANDNGVKKR